MSFRRTAFGFLFCFLLAGAGLARAQSHTHTARAFVQAPRALGMGDAVAALPHKSTAFFHNPAHLARVAPLRPHTNFFGAGATVSTNVFKQYAFYRNDLDPAIERGFENMSSSELEALYDEALRLGRQRTQLAGDVLLPSVMLQAGGFGLGGGLFLHGSTNHHFRSGGGGVPVVDLVGRLDAMALGTGAVDLSPFGVKGLSVGLTTKFTQRYLTVKRKPLDALDEDEGLHLFTGGSLGADLGLLYEPDFVPLPGRLTAGLALYDAVATDFGYTYRRVLTDGDAEDEALIAEETALANEDYGLHRSYRVGLAYTLPKLAGPLFETGVAIDYIGYSNPRVEQSALAHLHLGAEARLMSLLVLRTGLNQGYPTFGVGLDRLGFLSVEYAFYGVEEGRQPGQIARWNHTLQFTLGLF